MSILSLVTIKIQYLGKTDFFFRLSKISDTVAGFPLGRLRWDSLSAFGTLLCPTLLEIGAVVQRKALLWSGKINLIHPFTRFQDYRGFLVPACSNRHQVCILQVSIHFLIIKTLMDVFELFFVTAIAWHSKISNLKFRDNWNLPDWGDTYYRIFDLKNLNPLSFLVFRILKFPKIREKSVFWIIEVFLFRPTKMNIWFDYYRSKYMNKKNQIF